MKQPKTNPKTWTADEIYTKYKDAIEYGPRNILPLFISKADLKKVLSTLLEIFDSVFSIFYKIIIFLVVMYFVSEYLKAPLFNIPIAIWWFYTNFITRIFARLKRRLRNDPFNI